MSAPSPVPGPAQDRAGATAADSERLTVIEPRSGWRPLDLRELWSFRELLFTLVERDVRVRYKQTVLGAAWAILRPLAGTLVFTGIFGRLAKLPSEGAPYALFVFAGLLPWTFFAAVVAGAGDSLVGAQNLISKVYFPRLLVPLATFGTALLDLAVGLAVLLVLAVAIGTGLGPSLLLLPLGLLLLVVATLGPAVLLAALNVAYRDFRHLAPFLLQLWLFTTPVVFPATLVPERWRGLLYLNPVAGAVELFRAATLARPVDLAAVAISSAAALAILAVALAHFGRVERRFADIV